MQEDVHLDDKRLIETKEYIEVRQLINVGISKENSHNYLMQRERQLLNITVVNYVDIGQLFKTAAKRGQLLKIE